VKNNFCFIIPSYCKSNLHGLQLKRCISSIRKWHHNKIFIIDDFSDLDVTDYISGFENIEIIKSQVKAAGDMVTYYNFLQIDGFKNAIIFQDSMTLEHELENINDIDTINHIWYFTNHRHHWHKIKEPDTEYNRKNNIKVHDDLMKDFISKKIEKKDFKHWAINIYPQKNRWSGNIGCQSIVDKDFLEKLNKETGIVDLMTQMNNNRLRRVAESLFPLACQYILGQEVVESSYDGIYYDGVNPQNGFRKFSVHELGLGSGKETVQQVCKNKYFSKITLDRRPVKV